MIDNCQCIGAVHHGRRCENVVENATHCTWCMYLCCD